MADRIIKGDSGNDVVIQNNAGSRKIEVTNSGDVEVTGDVKTTTVKATNLKANDGTASLVVADSTGEVTSSGGLKAVNVKTTNLKANDGTAGLSIADSTGRVTITENNPVITLGSNSTFPAGHIIQVVTNEITGGRTTVTSASFNNADVIGDLQITPQKASSNILLTASITTQSNSTGQYIYLDFYKNASDVTETSNLSGKADGIARNAADHWINLFVTFLDTCSENSLTEKTYKIAGRLFNDSGTGYLGWSTSSTYFNNITAYEITT